MKNGWMAAVGGGAVLFFGCSTMMGDGALIGAGGGGLVGAGVGALAGGSKGAAIGAAIGAVSGGVTGAVIGKYMDNQKAKLDRDLKSGYVEKRGDKLVVKFDSGILFDTDDAQLKPASQTDLTEFARVLNEYPDTALEIEGRTDNTGSKAHNLKLSAERAGAVTDFLVASKVARSRLVSQGLGEDHAENSNATAEGRAKNRTVEIHIKANEELKAADAEHAKKKS